MSGTGGDKCLVCKRPFTRGGGRVCGDCLGGRTDPPRTAACGWCGRAYPAGRGRVRRVSLYWRYDGPTHTPTPVTDDVAVCRACAERHDRNPDAFGLVGGGACRPGAWPLPLLTAIVLLLEVAKLVRRLAAG